MDSLPRDSDLFFFQYMIYWSALLLLWLLLFQNREIHFLHDFCDLLSCFCWKVTRNIFLILSLTEQSLEVSHQIFFYTMLLTIRETSIKIFDNFINFVENDLLIFKKVNFLKLMINIQKSRVCFSFCLFFEIELEMPNRYIMLTEKL